MTIVIGTAGHIDHGKTSLLRALTGIDADRLPEEQRRGMTIDVGYAHLDLEDGTSIDFVDVPGHDALIGNMLVGAGEIDATLLVVATDDGIRAQTLEHLGLLDALGIHDGLAVVTKVDVAGDARAADVARDVAALLAPTSLAGAGVLLASATSGAGIGAVRTAIVGLRDRVAARQAGLPEGPTRLAIDRSFTVKGRGAVVTGTLRGGPIRAGDRLRLLPAGAEIRVRGLQVHHAPVAVADAGRVAVNVAGAEPGDLVRGAVLVSGGDGVVSTARLLVALAPPMASPAGWRGAGQPTAARPDGRSAAAPAWPPRDGATLRLHVGTAAVDARVGRRGREAAGLPDGRVTALLRLADPVATFAGERAVLRRPSPGDLVAGVTVLDTDPASGAARRRASPERLATLAAAIDERDHDAALDARLGLHGIEASDRGLALAPDVRAVLEAAALDAVAADGAAAPLSAGLPASSLRSAVRAALRRQVRLRRDDAAAVEAGIAKMLDDLVVRRRLARDGDRFRDPTRPSGPPPALAAAMDRLVALLDVPAPPDLSAAARDAGCPPEGIRDLEAAGRIVRVDADLAWSAPAFQRLAAVALELARRGPLAPAALRDATGTSRRVVMPLLEDLNRRGLLTRTAAGHVPGPRAPREPAARR
ncbi:MAG TPA: selenocysteine-specific translation elongation factor [Candidatus Limnocylindrales bacterium]|nr:selenocysteine-specific translation elongation factor [Candidatus Limnocylindrales bacterium]